MQACRAEDASETPFARRAGVVAFLDVVGYAALMGADEEATLRLWGGIQRDLIEPCVGRWHGRIVDRAGDGLLLEFPDAAAALSWAVEVQSAIAAVERPSGALPLRISVHAGPVFDGQDGRLHGDTVNTAARLQSFAEPGGIIISDAVHQAAAASIETRFLDLGPLHLRHIAMPVHAFSLRITRPWPAPKGRRIDPRPSIAVLPFFEAGAGAAYFAAGITESIVHALGGLEQLFVVSRGSTLAYSGFAVDPRAVGRALGVRYVLHGSVARAGETLRIAVELNDAETGTVVQTQRHAGNSSDLFELQDRISVQVASRLAPQLREHELKRALRKHPGSLDCYDLVLQALDRFHRLDRGSFASARALLQRAIAEDADFAPAFAYSAWWHVLRIAQGWSPDATADSEEAKRLAAAAVACDGTDPLGLAVHGYAVAYGAKNFPAALALLDRALAAAPNCALAWSFSGLVRAWAGDGRTAVEQTAEGLRLSPFDPFTFLHEDFHAMAHIAAGDCDAALTFFRRADAMNPRHAPTLRGLAVCLLETGQRDEACEIAQRMLELEPTFRISEFLSRTPLRGSVRQVFVRSLRELGLPS